MAVKLPKIYPLTSPEITKLSHLEQIRRFAAGGAKFVQLRDKTSAPAQFYEAANEVMNFARANDVKIIVNDRVDVALYVKADGVHLGQDDLPPAEARKILGENAIIGFSTHSVEQAVAAAKLPVDYIAIGPVFATKTKQNPDPIVGVEKLKKVRQAIGNFPLVAIGGIDFENAAEVFENGADSVAIVSALLNPPATISKNFARFSEEIKRFSSSL